MTETNKTRLCEQFCSNYARLGDIFEAALRAGFSPDTALAEASAILSRTKYRNLIMNLRRKNIPPKEVVMTGLERLAFGRANDAALLVFSEELPSAETIDSLDLFNVSEMKRIKGGGVEIKLFDRQKAMERIYEYASGEDTVSAASNLIEALAGSGAESCDEI